MAIGGMSKAETALELTDLIVGLLNLFKGRSGGNTSGKSTGSPSKGTTVSLGELAFRWWEQTGGSMKDEAELLKSLFADTMAKNSKVTEDEAKKIAALIQAMQPSERVVFRVALFLLEPETTTVTTPEKKIPGEKDGKEKTIPGSSKTERTGVDFRINTLKGIAALIKDDYSNANEVASMLRDTGALGSENKALRAYHKAVEKVSIGICHLFKVNSISEITAAMVEAKLKGIVFSEEAPKPKNILARVLDLFLFGGTGKAVPIFQGDGLMNALRRMLGIDTSHQKRRA